MKLPEKKQRWVYHAEALPQAAGEGVTRRVLAYTDGLMCVENTFEKGAVGALHHHPHTQITYVVSGAFEFTVDGVTHTVRAGDTILKEDGVELLLNRALSAVETDSILMTCTDSVEPKQERMTVEEVVIAVGRKPNMDLYHEMEAAFERVVQAGDCIAGGSILEATRTGNDNVWFL